MSEPSVEEIVAEIEAVIDGLPPSQPDPSAGLSDDEKRLVIKLPVARALIASWRARGEALEECAKLAGALIDEGADLAIGLTNADFVRARAALKDKP